MGRMYAKGVEIVPGFRIVQLLGRGGFGEVWKVTAPGGTDAAVKIIHLGERSGIKEYRSIKLVKLLRHPNLVPIFSFWLLDSDGKHFDQAVGDQTLARHAVELDLVIAMGLGEKNLLDRVRECQAEGKQGIPPDELLNYMQDAARAIDFLNQPIHDLGDGVGGIQHCDIKPQNILIVGGSAQVCDFGLARVLGDSRITSAKGSAAYMAPEMILDNKPSKATDQYSLAISYVELRTGELPLNISSPAAAIYAHVQGNLNLSKLSPAEQAVIKRATSADPEARYPTTIDLFRALRHAVERPAEQARPSGFYSVVRAPVSLDEMLRAGGEPVPGYKLQKMLGQGGYGQVWEAVAPGGKHVALKIIRNLETTHGKQEFKALELIKAVDHNHLMELHAYWLLDKAGNVIPDDVRDKPDAPPASTLIIASKLANQNLAQRLEECRAANNSGIPLPELIGYLRQAAQAIDYLNRAQHEMGDRRVSIQHRDIKPENILLSAGVVKVGDFGLAKVVEGTSAVIHGDSAGLTLPYAAPEIFTNRVTNWSDQYSLALTYYKLRTGCFAFPAQSKPHDIIKCHMNGKLDLSQLTPEERVVIARATALKPEARFPTCVAMVEELERACRLLEEEPTGSETLQYVPPGLLGAAGEPTLMVGGQSGPASGMVTSPLASRTVRPEPTAPHSMTVEDEVSAPDTVVHSIPTPPNPPRLDPRPTPPPPPKAPPVAPPVPPRSAEITGTKPPPTPSQKTLRPQKLPTQEHIDVETQRADPSMLRSSQQSIARRAPTVVWRGSAAARRQRQRQIAVVALLMALVFFMTVLALAAYRWRHQLFGGGGGGGGVAAEVKALLERGEFDRAYELTQGAKVPPDVARDLREQILPAWAAKADSLLRKDKDYDQAAKVAHAVLEKDKDNKVAWRVVENVRLAKQFRDDLAQGKDLEDLDRRLSAAGLPDEIQAGLREELLQTWLKQARQELAAKDYAAAVKTSKRLLGRFPRNADALALQQEARQTLYREADDLLARWAVQTRPAQVRKNPAAAKQLAAAAPKAESEFVNAFGLLDPDAQALRGQVLELSGNYTEAYDAYTSVLGEPDHAQPDKLHLLLERLEFELNPKWQDYLTTLRLTRPTVVLNDVRYADHAVELTAPPAPLDPTLRVRALALAGRARLRAIKRRATDEGQVAAERKAASDLFDSARVLASKEDKDWRTAYQMAVQFDKLRQETDDPLEMKRYRKDAVLFLQQAQARAASEHAAKADLEQRIDPLLAEFRAAP